MVVFPNAKINIGLNIVEKRKDGFHNIETVFYPIGISDVLEVVENTGSPEIIFKNTGIKIPGKFHENLCIRAYHLIKNDYKIPAVKIHLHKIIPMGAGLGGGSSDAGHIINLLNDLFSLKIPQNKKLRYASELGSDCSFFIKNKAAFATGRGEKLKELDFALLGYHLILIYPPVHVSTRDAYAEVKPEKPMVSLEELIHTPPANWKGNIINRFENTVFKKFPLIEEIKNRLYKMGAVYASMSGSGASVYGIFTDSLSENKSKKIFKNCFVRHEILN